MRTAEFILSSRQAGRALRISIILTVVALASAQAAPGALDSSFNPGTGPDASVRSLALQPGGRLLVGGHFDVVNGITRRRLARLNTNGAVDSTFNANFALGAGSIRAIALDSSNRVFIGGSFVLNGFDNFAVLNTNGTTLSVPRPDPNSEVYSILIQPDAKTVVAGNFNAVFSSLSRGYVTRLNPDGNDDGTFTWPRGANNTVWTAARQNDGKLLLGGSFTNFDGVAVDRLVRLNEDGTVDGGFQLSSGPDQTVTSILVQPDSRILVLGTFTTIRGALRRYIARLNNDGSLDESFDARVEAGQYLYDVGLDADGRIYVVGAFGVINGTFRSRIARLHPNGDLDTGFAPGSGADAEINTLAVQPDGNVVIGGDFTSYGGPTRIRLARVLGGAAPPAPPVIVTQPTNLTVFAGNTLVTLHVAATGAPRLWYQWRRDGVDIPGETRAILGFTNVQTSASGNYSVIVSNELGSVMSATATLTVIALPPMITRHPTNLTVLEGQPAQFAAAASGAPVPRYYWMFNGNDLDAFPGPVLRLTNVTAAQAGNYSVRASNSVGVVTSSVAVLTVNPAPTHPGAVDISFVPVWTANSAPLAAAVQPDGRIITAHFDRIRRFNSDGSVDPTFATNVIVFNAVDAIAVQNDGRILIGGTFASVAGIPRDRIARLNFDGTVDPTFNPPIGPNHRVRHIITQPDRKILVGCDIPQGGPGTVLRRLLPGGELDPNFRPLFREDTPGAFAPAVSVHDISLQLNGKILLAESGLGLRVFRLLPNGSSDLSFANPAATNTLTPHTLAIQRDGKIVVGSTDTPGRLRRFHENGALADILDGQILGGGVKDIFHQPDGKMLIAGLFTNVQGVIRRKVARLHADGTLDVSFDAGRGPSGLNERAEQIIQAPDGSFLVVGNFSLFNGYERPGMVRLRGDPQSAPAVTRHPAGHTVNVGQKASFSVDASGLPFPEYQWQFGGTNIPAATNPVLQLNAAQFADAGQYRVVVSNALGIAESMPALLSVQNATGKVSLAFAPSYGANDSVLAAIRQPDGKLILGGRFTSVNGMPRQRIARLNPDGSLDDSFNPGSGVTGASDAVVHALALHNDGSIFVGGLFTNYNGVDRNGLARLLSNGALDMSFHATNLLRTNTVRAIAVEPAGKVIIGWTLGAAVEGGPSTIASVLGTHRLYPDGSVDRTWTNSLIAAYPASDVRSLVLQPDGKVIAAGSFSVSISFPTRNLVRLQTNGLPDPTFTNANIGGAVNAVALLGDRVIIGGSFSSNVLCPRSFLAAFTSSGELIGGGWANRIVSEPVETLSIDESAGILIGGRIRRVHGQFAQGMHRLLDDGSLDYSFNPPPQFDGTVRTIVPIGDGSYYVGGDLTEIDRYVRRGIARIHGDVPSPPLFISSPTNTTLLAGKDLFLAADVSLPANTHLQWQRNGLNLAGETNATLKILNTRRDSSGNYVLIASNQFGVVTSDVAIVTINSASTMPGSIDIDFYPAPFSNTVYALVLEPDGTLIAGGSWYPDRFALRRFSPDGTLQQRFGPVTNVVYALALQPDGMILAGLDSGVQRFYPDGTRDTNYLAKAEGLVRSIALQPDGRLVIGGSFRINDPPGVQYRHIARLMPNGAVDHSFNTRPGADYDVLGVALQPDGKVLLGGWFTNVHNMQRRGVARLNTDGSLDLAFDAAMTRAQVNKVAFQPPDKIVLACNSVSFGSTQRYGIVRLAQTGAYDPNFNPPFAPTSRFYDLVIQPDGKIVAGGNSTTIFVQSYGYTRAGLVRLNRHGTFDLTFSIGMGVSNFLSSGTVYALAPAPRGDIYISGSFSHYSDYPRRNIARVNGDPEILGPFISPGPPRTLSIAMQTDIGRTYFVESAPVINAGIWSRVTEVAGNGDMQTILINTSFGFGTRFYRVRIDPATP